MLYLSKVIIANPDLESFEDLKMVIKELAARGEMYLRFDVKPAYPDTPPDWEDQLEVAFSSRY
ncbi:MAG: sulfur relay protein DsrC [Gammaproteobacteria bacterium]|nr:MAG: sulfur relay protein DsrC [Gammaproteobacteria bacterium]